MPKTIVLIVAAGRGMRAGGDIPKQYVKLGGKYVLTRTIEAFAAHRDIDYVAVVIHPDDHEIYQQAATGFDSNWLLPPINGGKTRQQSVCNGLKALVSLEPTNVLIHDAARPFVDIELISRVIDGLSEQKASLPVLAVTDTIKQVENNLVGKTVDRSQLYGAQTPQGFHFPLILELHGKAAKARDIEFTDDASIAEWAKIDVLAVAGSAQNNKLTSRADMQNAALILSTRKELNMQIRTGFGLDVHRFEEGDGVTLCGITIPFDKKLKGHSDADVAMHALTDAILGAIAKGDIGSHFPPGDPEWKEADSAIFLRFAVGLVRKKGGELSNVDVTIICEQPKIGPHRDDMRYELARLMDVDAHRVSVKATTTEQLGFTGRGEGIAAQAVATITFPDETE